MLQDETSSGNASAAVDFPVNELKTLSNESVIFSLMDSAVNTHMYENNGTIISSLVDFNVRGIADR